MPTPTRKPRLPAGPSLRGPLAVVPDHEIEGSLSREWSARFNGREGWCFVAFSAHAFACGNEVVIATLLDLTPSERRSFQGPLRAYASLR